MKLTERQKVLLREIYQVNMSGNFVITTGFSGIYFSYLLEGQSLQERLRDAIVEIDKESAMVQRVGEIIQEYEVTSLKPGDIERNGFTLPYRRLMNRIYEMLFPYTGIQWQQQSSNKIMLG